MRTLLRTEKGAAAVLTVLMLTCLIGFTALVVDIGALYLNKAQLSNMADAAALAGIQDLPAEPEQAAAVAESYAQTNGKPGDTVTPVIGNNNKTLSVTVTRTVNLFFARIFGLATADVKATATAALTPLSVAVGVVPFGVEKQNFVFGQTYELKEGAGGGTNGNYGALALGGKGASVYRNNIKYGYDSKIKVGDWVETEPGNMSGPTSDGIGYRIGLDPSATFATVAKGSPRIVIVPIINDISGNGRSEVQVVGFAAFFLEGVGGKGNNNYVYGKFMQMVIPDDDAGTASDYGLYRATLIQ